MQFTNHKTANSVTELEEILSKSMQAFEEAVSRREIYPHSSSAHEELKGLEGLQQGLTKFRDISRRDILLQRAQFDIDMGHYVLTFNHEGRSKELNQALAIVQRTKSELKQQVSFFDTMYRTIFNHIELDVLPTDIFDGERIYLAQGRLILPTAITTPGYYAFEISMPDCNHCKNRHIKFRPLTQRGYESVDDAIQAHVDPLQLGTVAIARNTEHYPLERTALPILRIKYEQGMYGVSGGKHKLQIPHRNI